MRTVLEKIESIVGRNIDRAVLLFFLVFTVAIFILISSPTWLSFFIACSVMIMFAGQVFLLTSFSQVYFLYIYSFIIAITISVLFWIAAQDFFSNYAYVIIVAALIGVPLLLHFITRERTGIVPIIPVYSIFFSALLIIISTSGLVSNNLASANFGNLFLVTIVLFIITSIFGLNISYRSYKLNRALKISNRNRYLEIIKEQLKKRYLDDDSQADIDLLTYYLSTSMESFINGDFKGSFMDAFKIIDNKGTSFSRIYSPTIDGEEWKKLNNIRKYLSHAKIEDKNKDKKGRLKDLSDVKKQLFKETLNILKIVKFGLIEKALDEKTQTQLTLPTVSKQNNLMFFQKTDTKNKPFSK